MDGYRQSLKQFDGVGRRTESGQRLELMQRHQQLGLVTGVAIVTHRRIHRDAESLLAPIALGCLHGAGMGLQRQRLLGGQHFDQKRQRVAEPGAGRRTELAFGIVDHGLQ
jgi:hypothetical protein